MNYFRFEIPKGLRYSPGWFGTMPKCPRNVVVDLYNEGAGYGLAHTSDVLPKEVTALTEKNALALLATVQDGEGVWFGQKLADRDWGAELKVEMPVSNPSTPETAVEPAVRDTTVERKVVNVDHHFCSVCHIRVCDVFHMDDGTVKVLRNGNPLIQGLIAKAINFTCDKGHEVRVAMNG
ncbi:MAG: hypothetical protein WC683_13640 [bacterium]